MSREQCTGPTEQCPELEKHASRKKKKKNVDAGH